MIAFLALALALQEPLSVSGIYPHLARSSPHPECGIGAVVPWAGKLWCITYPPHFPRGSEDGLYSIAPDLTIERHPASVGGTCANRLIHAESEQLFLGRYVIDAEGNVRVLDPEVAPGRLTATARHPLEPGNKVLHYDMEGRVYEVDVETLESTELFDRPVPGWHGKGAYTGQGRLVIANNGESPAFEFDRKKHLVGSDAFGAGQAGALAEWDGETWRLLARDQYCEVTGPGGIRGSATDDDPVWALGFDERSVLLSVLADGSWTRFRLPKASRAYDGSHGWYTEWPRIREVGGSRALLDAHGMLWSFPLDFGEGTTRGITPIASHLKMFVDFCAWRDGIVFACNDTSRFDNGLCGQAQSNLWFASWDELSELGPAVADGGVWLREALVRGDLSDPFLVGGFESRSLSFVCDGGVGRVVLELDTDGSGDWVLDDGFPDGNAVGWRFYDIPKATWARLRVVEAGTLTAWIHLSNPDPREGATAIFDDVAWRHPPAGVEFSWSLSWGLLRARDVDTLQLLADVQDGYEWDTRGLYYELDAALLLRRVDDPASAVALAEQAALVSAPLERGPELFEAGEYAFDRASAIVVDSHGRRFRLPRSHPIGDHLIAGFDVGVGRSWPRSRREVVTERELINVHGTIYELPRPSAGGMLGLRPVCTHRRMISDFCSWRGLLVLAGLVLDAEPSEHVIVSEDGKVALWIGSVDDLWKLGRPRGEGGPWLDMNVQADVPSDPYIMAGFTGERTIRLEHAAAGGATFTLELDVVGDGEFRPWKRVFLPEPATPRTLEIPDSVAAHWIRVRVDSDCVATCQLRYD